MKSIRSYLKKQFFWS